MEQETVQTQQEQTQAQQAPEFNPFDDSNWREDGQPLRETQAEVKTEAEKKPEQQVPQFDPNSYIKEKFGFETEEQALSEIKKLKESQNSVNFDNEFSKKFFEALQSGKEDEVFNYLNEKRRYERLSSAEVTDASIAADIIKASLAEKYKDLTPDEVEYKFNKNFGIPEKPQQGFEQSDEDYAQVVAQWEKQKAEIEKEMIIEAKIRKPEIASLKEKYSLSELQKLAAAEQQPQVSQEELAQQKAVRDAYVADLEREAKAFGEISVTAKVGDSQIPVSFVVTEDEKKALRESLFDFDSEAYLDSRWVKEDGRVDVSKVIADKYILENFPRIAQKIANESAAKAVEAYIKSRANVSINGNSTANVSLDDKTFVQKQEAAIWEA